MGTRASTVVVPPTSLQLAGVRHAGIARVGREPN
jgi:hypothetical protein